MMEEVLSSTWGTEDIIKLLKFLVVTDDLLRQFNISNGGNFDLLSESEILQICKQNIILSKKILVKWRKARKFTPENLFGGGSPSGTMYDIHHLLGRNFYLRFKEITYISRENALSSKCQVILSFNSLKLTVRGNFVYSNGSYHCSCDEVLKGVNKQSIENNNLSVNIYNQNDSHLGYSSFDLRFAALRSGQSTSICKPFIQVVDSERNGYIMVEVMFTESPNEIVDSKDPLESIWEKDTKNTIFQLSENVIGNIFDNQINAFIKKNGEQAPAVVVAVVAATAPTCTPLFSVNDKVDAQFGRGVDWFGASILAVNIDGSYNLLYDDGDTEVNVSESYIRPFTPQFAVEDKVDAQYGGGQDWFRALITAINKNGTYNLLYDDGDIEADVYSIYIRRFFTPFAIGDLVKAEYGVSSNVWLNASILAIHSNGLVDVRYDDEEVLTGLPLTSLRPYSNDTDTDFESYEEDINNKEEDKEKDTLQPKTTNLKFQIDDNVEVRYLGLSQWLPAKIQYCNQDDNGDVTYDVEYDDGEKEYRVDVELIRFPAASETSLADPEADVDLDVNYSIDSAEEIEEDLI